jgi:hypothetical protein
MLANAAVERAEWRAAREAVGGEEPVEGIARPVERHRPDDEGQEGCFVHDEPRVASDGCDEGLVFHLQLPALWVNGEVLNIRDASGFEGPSATKSVVRSRRKPYLRLGPEPSVA